MGKILYGECVWPCVTRAVRISGLTEVDCDLESESDANAGSEGVEVDGDCALWIGAIGPIEVTALRKGANQMVVRFKEPLSDRILLHFNAL